MKKCENCEKEHDGTYGSGRFCSSICARSFSTKEKRIEINEAVSKKLTKDKYNGLTKQQFIQRENVEKHASYQRETDITDGCMCSVLPHTYSHSKHKSQLAKLTYTTCYMLGG